MARRRVVPILVALGLALGLVGPALVSHAQSVTASPYWGIPEYDEAGNYVGCYSPYNGNFFTPAQITEDGCNSDWGELPLEE